jgi:anti-sigma factor RsiW
MNNIDDILLVAYVDGELAAEERLEVEQAIHESADIAQRVALLEAAKQSYRQAYAQHALPPVPESLKQKIAALTQAYSFPPDVTKLDTSSAGMGAGVNDPVAADALPPLPRSAPIRSRMRSAPRWLAVAFVAGAFCCGIVLRLAPGTIPGSSDHPAVQVADSGASPWVRAAVGYQQLFSRDTVALDSPSPDVSARTVSDIRHIDGLELRVPDLRSVGLTFNRVQRLRFHDKPLVQIVYLPQEGPPVALCVMKDAKPDTAVTQQRVDNMDVVTWRQAELSYALIAKPGVANLQEIGKQISGSGVAAMFSQRTSMTNETNG